MRVLFSERFTKVWYNKGVALYSLKKYEEAIKCFDKVLEIDPENPVAEKNRKAALKALGR
jgi:tetratricopeptide (TPR) repeat protein